MQVCKLFLVFLYIIIIQNFNMICFQTKNQTKEKEEEKWGLNQMAAMVRDGMQGATNVEACQSLRHQCCSNFRVQDNKPPWYVQPHEDGTPTHKINPHPRGPLHRHLSPSKWTCQPPLAYGGITHSLWPSFDHALLLHQGHAKTMPT